MQVYIDVTNPETLLCKAQNNVENTKASFIFTTILKKLRDIKVQTFKDIFFVVKHNLHLALKREVS